MTSIRSRLTLAACAVFAVLGMTASTASATNPSFPHNDYNPSNWHSTIAWTVETPGEMCTTQYNPETDTCPFGFSSSSWKFTVGAAPGFTSTCSIELSGQFMFDGTFPVSNVKVSGKDALCSQLKPASLPWAGSVCEYLGTGEDPHEFWYRLDPTFTIGSNVVQGSTFGQLGGVRESELLAVETLGYNNAFVGNGGSLLFRHSGTLAAEYPILITENHYNEYPAEECGWPELS